MNINAIVEVEPNPNVADFGPGDTVRVSAKVVEGDRERTQVFEGVVLKIHRMGAGSTFTVRRISHGIGVERTFLFHSPRLEKVEILKHAKVRRARLYYLRQLSQKKARLKVKTRRKDEIR